MLSEAISGYLFGCAAKENDPGFFASLRMTTIKS
jgi:hypothetical protein